MSFSNICSLQKIGKGILYHGLISSRSFGDTSTKLSYFIIGLLRYVSFPQNIQFIKESIPYSINQDCFDYLFIQIILLGPM